MNRPTAHSVSNAITASFHFVRKDQSDFSIEKLYSIIENVKDTLMYAD